MKTQMNYNQAREVQGRVFAVCCKTQSIVQEHPNTFWVQDVEDGILYDSMNDVEFKELPAGQYLFFEEFENHRFSWNRLRHDGNSRSYFLSPRSPVHKKVG